MLRVKQHERFIGQIAGVNRLQERLRVGGSGSADEDEFLRFLQVKIQSREHTAKRIVTMQQRSRRPSSKTGTFFPGFARNRLSTCHASTPPYDESRHASGTLALLQLLLQLRHRRF